MTVYTNLSMKSKGDKMKNMIICALAALPAFATASLYNGAGPGSSTIGTGGDYTTLETAVTAINASPLTGGNWTFNILNNLTVTDKLVMGQNLNGNTMTFKPATSVTATITFAPTATFTGWGLHWAIGSNDKNDATVVTKTDNVVIDGSNNGTSSRNLTITNTNNAFASSLIGFVADSDNGVVKNCILTNVGPSANALQCIRYGTITQGPLTDKTPDGGLVDNCIITANPGNGFGVSADRNGGSGATSGVNNLIVRNNQITAPISGIRLIDHRNATITGNTITMAGTIVGTSVNGISSSSGSSSTAAFTVTIKNNIFSGVTASLNSSAASLVAMNLTGEAASGGAKSSFVIENNMIGGIQLTASGSPSANYATGILCGSGNADFTIRHNSINLMSAAGYTIATPARLGALIISNEGASNVYTVTNNLIRVAPTASYGISKGTAVGTFTSANNNVFAAAGANFGRYNGTDDATLAAWKVTTSQDTASTVVDPLNPLPPTAGTWISNTNLRFSSAVVTDLGVAPVAGITTDVDGITRSLTQTYKGASETPGGFVAGIADWNK